MNKINRVKITVEALKQMYDSNPYWTEMQNFTKDQIRDNVELLNNIYKSYEYNKRWLAKKNIVVDEIKKLMLTEELKKNAVAQKELKKQ